MSGPISGSDPALAMAAFRWRTMTASAFGTATSTAGMWAKWGRRDLYGEFAAALRRRDLRVMAPFHIIRGFNWFLPGWNQWEEKFDEESVRQGREEGWDIYDPKYADFYWPQFSSTFADFLAQWKAVVAEVIDKYQPDLLWFDGGKFREDAYEPDHVGDAGLLFQS